MFSDNSGMKLKIINSARFGSTYTKIGTIQRRLAWPLRKDDTQIREAFHIFQNRKKKKKDRFIEQSFGLCGRRRGWDGPREQH